MAAHPGCARKAFERLEKKPPLLLLQESAGAFRKIRKSKSDLFDYCPSLYFIMATWAALIIL
jgi:hypothetical protein